MIYIAKIKNCKKLIKNLKKNRLKNNSYYSKKIPIYLLFIAGNCLNTTFILNRCYAKLKRAFK